MKRITTAAVAAAAAALMLSGCSSDEESSEASGLRKNTAAAQTTDTGTTPSETAAPEAGPEPSGEPAEPSTPAGDEPTAPARASDTTCAQFAQLDEPEQQQLIQDILSENPGSAFVDNPNAALGTAKLVCNAEKVADQKVSVVSGIIING